jgi:hypothetical protein
LPVSAMGEGDRVDHINETRSEIRVTRCDQEPAIPLVVTARDECLEQLIKAIVDIADRDDIHQAAERLARVQDWIRREAERAAADPIFDVLLRLAS